MLSKHNIQKPISNLVKSLHLNGNCSSSMFVSFVSDSFIWLSCKYFKLSRICLSLNSCRMLRLTRMNEQMREYKQKRAPTPNAAPIPDLFSTKGTILPAEKEEILETAYMIEKAKLNS